MKTKLVFIAFALCACMIFGQTKSEQISVEVGSELIIGTAKNNTYQNVHFPKANTIIKRGGIANYKSVHGNKVVVTSVDKKDDGSTVITIKRKDGSAFFGTHKTVKANVEAAIQSGELKATD